MIQRRCTNATLKLSGANNGNKGDQISLRVRGSDGSGCWKPGDLEFGHGCNTAPTVTVGLNKNNPQDNEILPPRRRVRTRDR